MRSKKERSQTRISTVILSALGIVIIALILATVVISLNLAKDQAKLRTAQSENTHLQQKKDNLTPNQITLPAGKFPLEANEKLLNRAYLRLMAFIYQRSDSEKNFNENKDTLVQYFSEKGYKKLKSETLNKDGNKIRSLSNKLTDCRVAFSNFNVQSKTIDVTIYSEYQLARQTADNKSGISLITLTYNFNSLKVSDFNLTSATIEERKVSQ